MKIGSQDGRQSEDPVDDWRCDGRYQSADAPNSAEREKLRKDCEQLAAQMAAIGNNFAQMTMPARATNPMSAGELFTELERRGMENLAGMMDAVVAASPAGPLWTTVGFAAATTAAGQTLSSDPSLFRAGITGTLYGASASGFVDSVRTATTGSGVLTNAARTIVKRAGAAGIVVTVVDVAGPPLIQYGGRNSTPRSNHPAWVRSQWESVVAPTLNALMQLYNDKGCGEVLSGN